jgi:hypothetical protein
MTIYKHPKREFTEDEQVALNTWYDRSRTRTRKEQDAALDLLIERGIAWKTEHQYGYSYGVMKDIYFEITTWKEEPPVETDVKKRAAHDVQD